MIEAAQFQLTRVSPEVFLQTSPSPDVMTQLQQLGQLKDEAVLTESEFVSKKTELLDPSYCA